ncbi:MAG: NYN domain-containing protein [Acidobacteriota bacterium]|jgi:uncharacterized LabA/DUF88 family protein|nr:NYN domain-containing protein [Acidobacteriota bacterium]
MNNLNEARLKIAVFIDVDNISIGVKQSMNRNFDVGAVLEAIKEKGEIITKVAYGDWKRADDFSRAMTQHAIQMVQRNATPGGDKNGADIALALDALETAFTRPHINAFVIVGGDSDFIALVEKLKQYDKTVFVVGGRGFTSIILQKNCHEFISYENLVGVNTSRKLTGRIQLSSPSTLENTMPLVRRALKILSDREVSPQLGLLKSTLLQLDSTFSERDYGVGSFRDFVQKLADAGYINLKQVDRSILVEIKEGFKEQERVERSDDAADSEKESPETPQMDSRNSPATPQADSKESAAAPVEEAAAEISETGETYAPSQTADASAALEELFRNSASKPHWPLYLRTFKQLLRAQQPPFDEKQYGVSSTYDLARQAQRDGLLHIERNRQGILRIFPGERFPKIAQETEEIAGPAPSEVVASEPVYSGDVSKARIDGQARESLIHASGPVPGLTEQTSADARAESESRSALVSGEAKEASDAMPAVSREIYAKETAARKPASSAHKKKEAAGKAVGGAAVKEKPKAQPRTPRKPAAAVKTTKPAARNAQNTASRTPATAKGKTKKKE